MRTGRGFYLFLRSGLLTAVTLALAVGAHVIGGGLLPDAGVLAGLTALALLPVTALTLRRVHPGSAVLALGAGQIALHYAFTALAAAGSCGVADGSTHSTHAGPAASAAAPATHCVSAASHLVPGLTGGDAIMTAAHIAAIMATAAVIAGSEQALALLLAWLTPFLLLLAPAVPASGRRLRALFDVVCPVLPRRNGPTCSLRGPPAPGVAAA